MASVGTPPIEGPAAPVPEAEPGAPARVAAIFERSLAGRATMREAAELANAGRELAVVSLTPQAWAARWGRAGGEGPYNVAMREEAQHELEEAREILGSVADGATFKMLTGTPRPNLAAWVIELRFAIVLLPHHRLMIGGHPYAKQLRRETSAEVRLVR